MADGQQAIAAKLHALRHVSDFDGSADVERWLDRMELALRIDRIPADQHADVLALHLEGAAHDTWKGLPPEKQADVEAVRNEMRAVFGLQRMDAWNRLTTLGTVVSGDPVDVAFVETRNLVNIAAAGPDSLGRVAACFLTARLPPRVRDQVLL